MSQEREDGSSYLREVTSPFRGSFCSGSSHENVGRQVDDDDSVSSSSFFGFSTSGSSSTLATNTTAARSAIPLHPRSRKSNPKLLILLRLIHPHVLFAVRARNQPVNKTEQRSRSARRIRETLTLCIWTLNLGERLGEEKERGKANCRNFIIERNVRKSKTTR